MPAFPEVTPPYGQSVIVTLSSGSERLAYLNGVQWWCGVDNDPNDVPIVNSFVVSWRHGSLTDLPGYGG